MIRGLVLCLALGLGLAGCSSGDDGGTTTPLAEAAKLVKARIAGAGKAKAAVPATAMPTTRADLAGVQEPLILAAIEKTGASATLRLARENAGYGTWVSPDKLSVTMKQGVLTASRGLFGDLLAGEADATLAALHTGESASYPKAMRYIGGDRQILLSRLTCQIDPVGDETIDVLEQSHDTRHMAEICTDSSGNTIRNDYWIGRDGTIWQSRQFLHPVMGYISFKQLLK